MAKRICTTSVLLLGVLYLTYSVLSAGERKTIEEAAKAIDKRLGMPSPDRTKSTGKAASEFEFEGAAPLDIYALEPVLSGFLRVAGILGTYPSDWADADKEAVREYLDSSRGLAAQANMRIDRELSQRKRAEDAGRISEGDIDISSVNAVAGVLQAETLLALAENRSLAALHAVGKGVTLSDRLCERTWALSSNYHIYRRFLRLLELCILDDGCDLDNPALDQILGTLAARAADRSDFLRFVDSKLRRYIEFYERKRCGSIDYSKVISTRRRFWYRLQSTPLGRGILDFETSATLKVVDEWIAQAKRPVLIASLVPQVDPLVGMSTIGQLIILRFDQEARLRLAIIGTKLEQIKRSRGKYPDSLEEFCSVLVTDPFGGELLRYRPDNGTVILYSVGRNGRDDFGNLDPFNGDLTWGGCHLTAKCVR